jgi:hypothetical protein
MEVPMKFFVYERVPQWLSYRKTVEASSAQEALALVERVGWSEIDSVGQPEAGPLYGDTVEGVAVHYEAEPAEK